MVRLAAKKLEGSPLPANLLRGLEADVDAILARDGYRVDKVKGDVDQVFHIRRLQRLLEAAGDPDWRVLSLYARGVPLGVDKELPRTPAVGPLNHRYLPN